MDMASASNVSKIRKFAFVAIGVSLIAQTVSPCLALGLPNLSSQKRTALQYEVYSKMSPGAGPQTNDLQKQEPQLDNNTPTEPKKPVDLSPVTMDEGQKSDTSLGPSEEGVFKATVKLDRAAVSGPVEQAADLGARSIKQSVNEKVLSRDRGISDMAKQVNVVPLALMPSADEEQNKTDVKFNAEKIELADLWDSTLARSQDIQFVVQKLMPSNNSGKTANVMMKMLSATVFGGMGMMGMMAPNMGAQMATNTGASLMMQALNGMQGAADKKARLSQTEAIMLYTIVRNTADKVVTAFREYKTKQGALERATIDLGKLQEMVKEVRASQTPVEQIKLQSVIMEKQSAIEEKSEEVSRFRQALVDLSGTEAVAKLDKQLEIDRQKIAEADVLVPAQDQQQPVDPSGQPQGSLPSGTLVAPTNGAVTN
ncbi:MAG: hypothetical protein HYX67_11990 [Candidatus Melainabacteria bacterium]|nr:hypothetical protein [Candidatus Melainabacteria bacterium]